MRPHGDRGMFLIETVIPSNTLHFTCPHRNVLFGRGLETPYAIPIISKNALFPAEQDPPAMIRPCLSAGPDRAALSVANYPLNKNMNPGEYDGLP